MARARNPKRDEALQLYLESNGQAKLKDIAAQVGIPDSRIRKWKTEDKWDDKIKERSDSAKGALLLDKGSETELADEKRSRGGQPGNGNAKGHGAPLGNGNALGNNGGAPPRNGNAVKTGEYQTLWEDYLSDEERLAYENIDTDKLLQINKDIRLLTWRENAMMKRIHELRDGIDNVETQTVWEMRAKQLPVPVYDETAGAVTQKTTTVRQLEITEIRKKENSLLGEILRIEEALTRVQDKKAKFLQAKHKIELDVERLELERRRVAALEKQSGVNDEAAEDLTVTIVYE